MTIKTPEDFVKIGHVRPSAFVRDINPTEAYLKDTRIGPEDLERLAEWCLSVAAWCRSFDKSAVQLSNASVVPAEPEAQVEVQVDSIADSAVSGYRKNKRKV